MIFVIMFLAGYPAFELSRCIIKYNILDDLSYYPVETHYLELAVIWGFYICIPVILNIVLGRK